MWIHSNSIKKLISSILGTNANTAQIDKAADILQPIIDITPDMNIIKGSLIDGAGGTLYTTPTDKNFYWCGFHATVKNGAALGPTADTITFTLPDGSNRNIFLQADDTVYNTCVLTFGKRGILLKKGTVISYTQQTTEDASATIWGYTGDDRATN